MPQVISRGNGTLSGTVEIKGTPNVPVSRWVRLYRQDTGQLVGETTSATDGSYTFTGLDPSVRYVVLSHDPSAHFRGVIADHIEPV